MARKKVTTLAYRAIRVEGGLIPADELARLTTLAEPALTEQTEAQYRISKGLKLRDEIGRDFKIALSLWSDFKALRKRTDVDAHDVTVRELLLPLMRDVLHFSDISRCAVIKKNGHSYAIGHAAEGGRVPLVLAAHDKPLDTAAERFGETNPDTGKVRRRSSYMLAQEALNASDASLWAIVTNGLTLRILRDNPSLTRPAYIEVDLEALFTEELHPDFTAFWLLAHASRFSSPSGEPTDCVWERWRATGQAAGVAVRTNLRFQVADALRALGTGFLSHPANGQLRAALQRLEGEDGALGRQAFFEELLRLIYRLIFLSTVEDRTDKTSGQRLIFTPEVSPEVQRRYLSGYSMTWLRERAVRRSQHDRHADLWQALKITFSSLTRGEAHLGLPALGGLFDADQCAWLDDAQLENRWLLAAVFQLGWFRADGGLIRVNYRDMGPEELGSVYESLLELVPNLQMLSQPSTARLTFVGDDDGEGSTKGNTRKLTGSYYTPDNLVQELIKTALEPVIADTIRASPERPVEALLGLSICDPACGSGHFLLSAARRLADEVALHRAAAEREGGAPTPVDYRHALRDVVSRCIYGVDKNPMAIQLAKTALWLEAYSPDRPLSFVDHHLRVGDALLGVLDPKVLEHGIPDEAYTALSGDDKAVASALKKQNKVDLKSWRAIAGGDLLTQAGLAAQAVTVETLDDDTPEHLTAKRLAWVAAEAQAKRSVFARLADTYVAAFLAPKLANAGSTVPLSGYLWGVLSGQPAKDEIESIAQALCRQHSVFHWWLAFPQVAARGGFDVMLGNPPWEQLQLSEEEFFASRAPSIAALAGSKRKLAIATLETEAPWLWTEFNNAKRQTEAANQYFRSGGRFPLSARGKLDTYPLFSETFLRAVAASGMAGFIVKSGIATDDSNKFYFANIVETGRLVSLIGFDNAERIFPAVHPDTPFVLVTLGKATQPSRLLHYALRMEHLIDSRREFRLSVDEFALINPNTRTCPVFRSERDAELTKKLYRATPVLIEEAVTDESGKIARLEVNPWGISFSQGLFNMTSDSSLFADTPVSAGQPVCLPLYEAKMIHQFDHRWATYVDAAGGPTSDVETADVSEVQKTDPAFTVRPRYWVNEREVLVRIARVPTRVSRTWLASHSALETGHREAVDATLSDLLLALAQWVAGELFHKAVGTRPSVEGWTPSLAQPHIAPTEVQINVRFPRLGDVLRGDGLTTKRALTEFPKWARQNVDARLDDNELADLSEALRATELAPALQSLLDGWMDRRSPRWLMGWRDITNATNERTVIASVVPRVGVGNKIPLFFPRSDISAAHAAALLGNLSTLTLDFVARQKIGGTTLNYFYLKQFPILSPDRYTAAALDFIAPRVLELTYTAHDLKSWADDLTAYDLRPAAERGQPFAWNPERRAQLRAELDAYFARLYNLTRDELRYILDPTDVMGADYPSETFRVLKNSEVREFGEYRTQRLVLGAWDRLNAAPVEIRPAALTVTSQFSELGMIRSQEEAQLAGLIVALVEQRSEGSSVSELQSFVARSINAEQYLDAPDGQWLAELSHSLGISSVATQLLDRVRPIVQRLESIGVLVRQARAGEAAFNRGESIPPGDVRQVPEHSDVARLLIAAESRRLKSERAGIVDSEQTSRSTGTR